MKKRDLFNELMQGVNEMAAHREGKLTLRQSTAKPMPVPSVPAEEIVMLRKRMKMSQAVFAQRIRTSPATLRNWEQDKSKPNAQAALLIKLVAEYPDMINRMAAV